MMYNLNFNVTIYICSFLNNEESIRLFDSYPYLKQELNEQYIEIYKPWLKEILISNKIIEIFISENYFLKEKGYSKSLIFKKQNLFLSGLIHNSKDYCINSNDKGFDLLVSIAKIFKVHPNISGNVFCNSWYIRLSEININNISQLNKLNILKNYKRIVREKVIRVLNIYSIRYKTKFYFGTKELSSFNSIQEINNYLDKFNDFRKECKYIYAK